MDMQAALRARLLAGAGVAAEVGTRIFWGIRPQNTPLAALVLNTISDDRPQRLKAFEDFRETRVQADCLAANYATARRLAEAVVAVAVQPAISNGVRFLRAGIEGPADQGEDTAGGYVHRQRVDLLIRHGVT